MIFVFNVTYLISVNLCHLELRLTRQNVFFGANKFSLQYFRTIELVPLAFRTQCKCFEADSSSRNLLFFGLFIPRKKTVSH